jgi:phosphoribosylformylglycinamidine cyclo-ligase
LRLKQLCTAGHPKVVDVEKPKLWTKNCRPESNRFRLDLQAGCQAGACTLSTGCQPTSKVLIHPQNGIISGFINATTRRQRAAMTRGLTTKSKAPVRAVQDHYRDAGVDTDEADAGLKKLANRIKGTWPAEDAFGAVKLGIGYFANVVDVCGQGIAISTDGIGSKAMIAWMLRKFDTVGIDCVAMNANDIICVGATPVTMVDYVAVEKVEAAVLDAISVGLAAGAKMAGISISGGETAQLKGMINGFDLAGTAIGHVSLDKILVGQNIEDGDVVIGVESNGIHSNGLSLARRAFFEGSHQYALSHRFPELSADLGNELLRPTHIYVQEALELLKRVPSVRAFIHVTSDGFLNLTRVKADVSYVVDELPPVPPIFSIIQRLDGIDDTEMFSVFNMGIGFCAVVPKRDADTALTVLGGRGKKAYRIGYAVSDPQRQVSIKQYGLVGQGKHFRRI